MSSNEAPTIPDNPHSGDLPKSRKVSYTKTIRFNEKEKVLFDSWDKDVVKLIKEFLWKKLSWVEAMKGRIRTAEDPRLEKKIILEERMRIIKQSIPRKDVSQEEIDTLSSEYWELRKFTVR